MSDTEQGLISIIVPVYNVEAYLDACIQSVLAQTYKYLELILVDDGATDGSGAICDRYAALHTNIVVYHRHNAGVSSARNWGIDHAKGQYITFVDSDDKIKSDMYASMIRLIKKTGAQMCACTHVEIEGVNIDSWHNDHDILTGRESIEALMNCAFPTSLCNCVYSSEVLTNVRLNPSIHHLEDLDFQFRALCNVNTVAICNQAFYIYTQRDGSANHSGFNEKVLSCMNVLPTIESYAECHPEFNSKYVSITRFRLIMTICSFYIRSKERRPEIEKEITRTARKVFWDVLHGDNKKMKLQVVLSSLDFKAYKFIYKIKH